MKLLVISNGHGEDVIAVRIVEKLKVNLPNLEIAALPIVGEGNAYIKNNIALVGQVKQMPSGGFIYMDSKQFWRDLQGGLLKLTLAQLKIIRQWSKSGGFILAVGDIVPLLFAWLSNTNYAFVGTAKSEYYLRDEQGWLNRTSWLERWFGSVYLPWERWLMSRDRALAVFPRDDLTAEILKQWSIPVYNFGNPMMDGIGEVTEIKKLTSLAEKQTLSILLLPGSRMPEALNNWQQIIDATSEVIKTFSLQSILFIAAIAPGLEILPFQEYLLCQGWNTTSLAINSLPINDPQAVIFSKKNASLILTQNAYSESLQLADLAIAMAGTATEQFVGLGKPVITMPGTGPQFTAAFAEAQTRLLGISVILVEKSNQIAQKMLCVLNNAKLLESIAINGQQRMGKPGAAERIAECLQQVLLK
ncbi:lipid-A-disaccharide synthase-related protein [Stanieria cyanosphaera]|nr:lipid-A-disaccharide synthase-related protein [Stanieria cyanosphaera]